MSRGIRHGLGLVHCGRHVRSCGFGFGVCPCLVHVRGHAFGEASNYKFPEKNPQI